MWYCQGQLLLVIYRVKCDHNSSTFSPAPSVIPSMWVRLKTVCPLVFLQLTPSSRYPHQISQTPFDISWNVYSITYPLILITSPAAILNLPINSLCPLDTALVLTSGNFHLIFSPSPSLLQTPGGTFHVKPSLPFVHLHLLSSDWHTSVIIKIFWMFPYAFPLTFSEHIHTTIHFCLNSLSSFLIAEFHILSAL